MALRGTEFNQREGGHIKDGPFIYHGAFAAASARTAVASGAGLGALSVGGRHIRTSVRRRSAADRHLAGRLAGRHRHHRRHRAAHRRLCGAGRRRAQGHAARGRAHQRGPPADQEDRAEGHQGPARQAGEAGRRRLRRQAERCGAGAADLHQRQQDRRDDRLDLVRGRGGAQQVRRAREDPLSGGDLRLQRHHRQGLRALLASASASTARPRRTRSARCW